MIPSAGSNPSFAWRGIWNAGRKLWQGLARDHDRSWRRFPNPIGEYSVKVGYKTLTEVKERVLAERGGESSEDGHLQAMWKKLWRLKIEEKVKFFIWKLYYNAIPLMLNLYKRGCNPDPHCKICGKAPEEEKHTFFDCWWAKALWSGLGYSDSLDRWNSGSIRDMLCSCITSFPVDKVGLILYGLRSIWYNRNLVVHGSESLNPFVEARKVKERCETYAKNNFKFIVTEEDGQVVWTKPKAGTLKINCDAAINVEESRAAFACIARDHDAVVNGIVAGRLENVGSIREAEGSALWKGISWARRLGWQNCEFETDNAEVFEAVMRNKAKPKIEGGWRSKCATELAEVEGQTLRLVRREANTLADRLAKKSLAENWSWNARDSLPRFHEAAFT